MSKVAPEFESTSKKTKKSNVPNEKEEDIKSVASSSIHSEEIDEEQEEEKNAAIDAVRRRSKFINARNQLRDTVLKEVMGAIMPDVGGYDMDGMGKRAAPEKSKIKLFLKYLGILDLSLHEAVLSGSEKHVKRSINVIMKPGKNKSPDPSMMNSYDDMGRTPLSLAVKIKNTEMVQDLLENEALPDICDESTGRTNLMFSVLNRTLEITQLLIRYNASVDMSDFQCITPLMLACHNGDMKHVEFLCKKLADVDAQDENGWSPLHYAVMGNAPKVISHLLYEGANRALRDANKRRALDIARYKDYGECIALLSTSKSFF